MKIEMSTLTPMANEDPRKIAWDTFTASHEYQTMLRWGQFVKIISLDLQEGKIVSEHPHIEGSLCGAFLAGYEAGRKEQE